MSHRRGLSVNREDVPTAPLLPLRKPKPACNSKAGLVGFCVLGIFVVMAEQVAQKILFTRFGSCYVVCLF